MNESIINDQVLAQYLLGMLSQREKEDIEERIFANDTYYNQLLLIEDELFDEYVNGHLSVEERNHFEKNFLNSSERYKKIEFAQKLRENLNRFLTKPEKNTNALSNTALIHLLAQSPNHLLAGNEFFERFDKFIRLAVLKASRRSNSTVGRGLLDDLMQDVYMKLFANDGQALKQFKGQHENSIFVFLQVIATRVVMQHRLKMMVQKRRRPELLDHPSDPLENYLEAHERQEIENVLEEVITGRNKERDKAIFKTYLFEYSQPERIALNFDLSQTRVKNIISMITKKIREKFSKKSS